MRFIEDMINQFRHFKLATLLNLLGLSFAFTVFYVIVSQVWYEHNFDRSYPEYERIYRLEQTSEKEINQYAVRPLLEQIIQSSSHIKVGGIRDCWVNDVIFSVADNPAQRYADKTIRINEGYTDVFSFKFVAGGPSGFNADVDNVLIPLSLSLRLFGSESAIHKVIKTSSSAYSIAGVYEDFPENSSVKNVLYLPLGTEYNQDWGNGNCFGFVRLDAFGSADKIAQNVILPEEYVQRWGTFMGKGHKIRLFPMKDIYFYSETGDDVDSGDRTITFLLLGIACLIVLIAGINFTNFSMALAPVRMKSVNTQKVMGASIGSLRWGLLSEALFLALIAFFISLIEIQLISHTDLDRLFIADITPGSEPFVFFVCGAVALIIGLLAGFWPAYYIVSFPPALVLKGAFLFSMKGVRFRNGLIGFQFFITFILLVVSSFIYQQNRYMTTSPLGFDKERLITIDFDFWFWSNLSFDKSLQAAIKEKAKVYPGCETLFGSDRLLLNKKGAYEGWRRCLNNDESKKLEFSVLKVTEDFLKNLDIPILEGADFSGESGELLFNETARKKYNLKIGDKVGDNMKVIGFVPDIKIKSLRMVVEPLAFVLDEYFMTFYIKLAEGTNEKDALAYYRKIVFEIDSYAGYVPVKMMDEVVDEVYEKEQNEQLVISLFCGLSMLIAVMGIFGLVVFESQIRRKEIGIRKINGATAKEIIMQFNRIYLRIVLISFVLAAPLAWYAVYRWLEGFAYHIRINGWIFAAVLLMVLLITVLIVTVQCWRTANQNPVESIKNE